MSKFWCNLAYFDRISIDTLITTHPIIKLLRVFFLGLFTFDPARGDSKLSFLLLYVDDAGSSSSCMLVKTATYWVFFFFFFFFENDFEFKNFHPFYTSIETHAHTYTRIYSSISRQFCSFFFFFSFPNFVLESTCMWSSRFWCFMFLKC